MLLLIDQGLTKGIKQNFPFTKLTLSNDKGRKIISTHLPELSNSIYKASTKFTLLSNHHNVVSVRGIVTSADTKADSLVTSAQPEGLSISSERIKVSSTEQNVISTITNVETDIADVIMMEVNVESEIPNVISVEGNDSSVGVNVKTKVPNLISTETNLSSTTVNVFSKDQNVISAGANVLILVQKEVFPANSKRNELLLRSLIRNLVLQLKTAGGCTL